MTMRLPARGEAGASATLAAHFFEDGLRTGLKEEAGNVFAEGGSLAWSGSSPLADVLRAVNGADAGFEDKFAALGASPGADGNLAATLQRGEQRALGDDSGAGLGVVKRAKNLGGFGIGETTFGGNGALANGGKKNVGRESFGDAIAPTEAVETGFGEEDGVVFTALGFAEASVNVAAKFADVEVGPQVAKLGLSAKAAGADAGAMAEVGKSCATGGDQAIAHIFAAEDGGKRQAGVDLGGNVFDTVDGDIDRFVEQRVFKFLDEDAFAANLGQGRVGEFVALRLDDDNFGFHAGGGEKAFADVLGLPFGEQAAAGADAKGSHGLSFLERKRSRRASTF